MTPGRKFGRYTIEKTLGNGGMGSVFLAHDPKLDRLVALKTMLEGRDAGRETVERFHREARAAAGLRHPNLCKVHDVDEIDGVHFLTMEYIEGTRLSDLLGAGATWLPASSALEIALGAALGLAEAHGSGVIHRDLKPANIMIDRKGDAVIVDFGLARREREYDLGLTQSGTILCTPLYASPEQWMGDSAAVGAPSDIFSLGVVLYEMLAGRTPFDGPTRDALKEQILHEDPEPPSAWRAGIDPRLDEICLRALAKAPRERFPSMAEFARSLEAVLKDSRKGEGITAVEKILVKADGPFLVKPGGRGGHDDGPDRGTGLDFTSTVLAVVACLVVLAFGVWLADQQWRWSKPGPSTPAPADGRPSGMAPKVEETRHDAVEETPPEKRSPEPGPAPELTAPGRARVTTAMEDVLTVVRRSASDDSPFVDSVRAGQEVKLVELSDDRRYFKICDAAGRELGWVAKEYLDPAPR